MGVKSKGNYKLNLCLKFDCLDRNTEKCQTCILFSNYIKNVNNDEYVNNEKRQ